MSFFEHPQVDWVLTFISAVVVSQIYSQNVSFLFVFAFLIFISIPLHYYFDVPTHTNYYLNLSKEPASKKNLNE